MRDSLTVAAGAFAVALLAALVAPPFVDWEARRTEIDGALSRAIGVDTATEGRLELRLLPSPRLRLDRLVVGARAPERASLDARFVKAEIALTALFRGELHVTEARVGRAELRLPATASGAVALPSGASPTSGFAVDDLRILEFAVTTTVPETGRTNQVAAANVRVATPSLAGPWRIEGEREGVPFRLTTGEADGETVPVKLATGGDTSPRLEIDARLGLQREAGGASLPVATGTARLVVGPPAQAAGAFVPMNLQGNFRIRGRRAEFEGVTAEIGGGGAGLRTNGRGALDLETGRASLTLDARRFDLDGFLTSAVGQGVLARGEPPTWPGFPTRIDLALAVDAATLGQEEWTGLALDAAFTPAGRIALRRLAAVAPGDARLAASGDYDGTGTGAFNGRVTAAAAATDRLGRTLAKFGLGGPLRPLLDGRPLDLAADVSATQGQVALRNARIALGLATLTGNARYVSPVGGARGRFDAQLAGRGIDLAALPLQGALEGLASHDLGLTLDLAEVRYGPAGARSGRVAANVQSDGPALVVDRLEVSGLAGAEARLAGRIDPDGSGRIAGRVAAADAGALLDLLGRSWAGTRLVPPFLRNGEIDLQLSAERDATTAGRPLRTTATGRAAGARLDGALVLGPTGTQAVELALSGEDASRWLGRPNDVALRRPATLSLKGVRVPAGRLSFTLAAEVAGARLTTTRPIALAEGEDAVESGEVEVTAPDLTPFLGLAGDLGAGVPPGPIPAGVRVGIGRERGALTLELDGRVAGGPVQAGLVLPGGGGVTGRVAVERLSLPWLTGALALTPGPEARTAAGTWSGTRFGPLRRPVESGEIDVTAGRLDLGRGLVADGATFTMTLLPQGFALRDLDLGLLGGRLSGAVAFNRQEGLASVAGEGRIEGVPLASLAAGGEAGLTGRLSGTLRFGASGESVASLVANLAGSGEVALADLAAPGADPTALTRALGRALAEDDPLRTGRLSTLVTEALGRAPFRAKGPVGSQAALVGGALRIGPVAADAGPSAWTGTATFDLRTLRLEARGALAAREGPKDWAGRPTVLLAYAGPVGRLAREVDVAPLTNGLAAIVLQRELEKIELYELDAAERARRTGRLQMDRARVAAERAAAEDAVRQAADAARQRTLDEARRVQEEARRAREAEAARQAEIARQADVARQAEAARLAEAARQAEAARLARVRAEAEARRQPLDIRPPAGGADAAPD